MIVVVFLGLGALLFSEEELPPVTKIPESGKFDAGGKTCTLVRAPENPLRSASGELLHPSKIAGDPFVLFENGTYRMWFTVLSDERRLLPLAIAYAESQDGVTWDVWKDPSSLGKRWDDYLVLKPVKDGWNALGVETVSVVRSPAGKYHMYYTGDMPPEGSHLAAIGLATSDDGIRWAPYGDGPIFEAENSWEQPVCDKPEDRSTCVGGVMEPSVIYDAKERVYKMWYAGIGKNDEVISFRIGYATSPDGMRWSRRKDPVFDKGGQGAWDELWVSHTSVVPDLVMGYHLFYVGTAAADYCEGCDMQRGAIGHAYSTDGITWQRDVKNPILAPQEGAWDAWTVGGPSVIFRNNEVLLWYFGQEKSQEIGTSIGLLNGTCE